MKYMFFERIYIYIYLLDNAYTYNHIETYIYIYTLPETFKGTKGAEIRQQMAPKRTMSSPTMHFQGGNCEFQGGCIYIYIYIFLQVRKP